MNLWIIWIRHVTPSLLNCLASVCLLFLHKFRKPTYTFTFYLIFPTLSLCLSDSLSSFSLSVFLTTVHLCLNLALSLYLCTFAKLPIKLMFSASPPHYLHHPLLIVHFFTFHSSTFCSVALSMLTFIHLSLESFILAAQTFYTTWREHLMFSLVISLSIQFLTIIHERVLPPPQKW